MNECHERWLHSKQSVKLFPLVMLSHSWCQHQVVSHALWRIQAVVWLPTPYLQSRAWCWFCFNSCFNGHKQTQVSLHHCMHEARAGASGCINKHINQKLIHTCTWFMCLLMQWMSFWTIASRALPEAASPWMAVTDLVSGLKSTPAFWTVSMGAARIQVHDLSLVLSKVPIWKIMAKGCDSPVEAGSL